MSQKQKESVSKIVEKYRERYPTTERKVLRQLILAKYPKTNSRTLDRHLKKAFKNEVEKHSRIERSEKEVKDRFWKQIDEIRHEFVYGSPSRAYDLFLLSYQGFPSPQREIAAKIIADTESQLQRNKRDIVDLFLRGREELRIKKEIVSYLLQKLE